MPTFAPTATPELTPTEEIVNPPEIEGLKVSYEEDKIVYRAEAENPYGLKEGDYAGEFVPDVVMKDKKGQERKTGGVVLTASAALTILNQQLSQIPEGRGRWLIPLPVDIRGVDKVSIAFVRDELNIPVVKVTYSGYAPVVNVIPDSKELRVAKTFLGDWIYIDQMRLIEPYTDTVYPGLEKRYLTVRGMFLSFTENVTVQTTFGAKVTVARGPIYVAMGAAHENRPVTSDKILYVEQVPIFVAANPPE